MENVEGGKIFKGENYSWKYGRPRALVYEMQLQYTFEKLSVCGSIGMGDQ